MWLQDKCVDCVRLLMFTFTCGRRIYSLANFVKLRGRDGWRSAGNAEQSQTVGVRCDFAAGADWIFPDWRTDR